MLPGCGVHAGGGVSVTVDPARVQPKGSVSRRPITCSGRTKEVIGVAKVCAGRPREGISGDWEVWTRGLGGGRVLLWTPWMEESYVCLR